MLDYSEVELISVFLIIGLSTFFMRAVFMYKLPDEFNRNIYLKRGLEAVPGSLLVALVIPYSFFINGQFDPFRLEVFVLGLTFITIYFIKKPGLSLIIAIFVYTLIINL